MVFTISLIVCCPFQRTATHSEIKSGQFILSKQKERVYYNNIDSSDAVILLDTLHEYNFFGYNHQLLYKIESTQDEYRFLLSASRNELNNPQLLAHCALFQSRLQQSFPQKSIGFRLVPTATSGNQVHEIIDKDSMSLKWMKRPIEKESDSLIIDRLCSYLRFWKKSYQYGINNNMKSIKYAAIPNVIDFQSNNIALISPEYISEEWIETFYDSKSAVKAYEYLKIAMDGVTQNKSDFESRIISLDMVVRNLTCDYPDLRHDYHDFN